MLKYGKVSGDLNLHFETLFDNKKTVQEISELYFNDIHEFYQRKYN